MQIECLKRLNFWYSLFLAILKPNVLAHIFAVPKDSLASVDRKSDIVFTQGNQSGFRFSVYFSCELANNQAENKLDIPIGLFL
jgi:hypothetical protein